MTSTARLNLRLRLEQHRHTSPIYVIVMSDKYFINYSIDGHPICCEGQIMVKHVVIDRLNELEKQLEEAVDIIETLFVNHTDYDVIDDSLWQWAQEFVEKYGDSDEP